MHSTHASTHQCGTRFELTFCFDSKDLASLSLRLCTRQVHKSGSTMESCTQCANCANLTIEHLIDLAHEEFSQNDRVPSAACYELHDSIKSLEIAADAGCEFCYFLVACLKGYPDNGNWIADAWQGEDCDLEHSLLARARQLQHSEVRLCIVSDDSDPNDTLVDVKVLDTLLVQIGPHDAVGEEMEDGMETFPVFKLTLATSRGACGTSSACMFYLSMSIY